MLQLNKVRKIYTTGDIKTNALDGVSISFREKEFVAILGPSGSGKTTFLNIVGGLDRYTSGDLVIKGKSTAQFSDSDWDAYRNNSVGYVFQNYNLINHLNVLKNVELGMELSGVSTKQKHDRAIEVLTQVGLRRHANKNPSQLSGGEMQRVAIARALANDPEILLCDEPTGALDTVTSKQIMDLITKISQDRLVVMVTHNSDIARNYASRIVHFQDGKVLKDSRPYDRKNKSEKFSLKQSVMSFSTALKLSGTNLLTKKWRTALTAIASSIGITAIAVVLSLSNGFQKKIDDFQTNALSEFPILISQTAGSVNLENMSEQRGMAMFSDDDDETSLPTKISVSDSSKLIKTHTNIFSDEFLEYVNNVNPEIATHIGKARMFPMNGVLKTSDGHKPITLNSVVDIMADSGTSSNAGSMMTSMSGAGLSTYPTKLGDNFDYLDKNYNLLYGNFPNDTNDAVLVLDSAGKIDISVLEKLGFTDLTDNDTLDFKAIEKLDIKLASNNDYYQAIAMPGAPNEAKLFVPNQNYQAIYNSDNSVQLNIVGVISQKGANIGLLAPGLIYSDELVQKMITDAKNSEIVKTQEVSTYSVFPSKTGIKPLSEKEKKMALSMLGASDEPFIIMIYPKDFDSKENLIAYLNDWNTDRDDIDKIAYVDLAGSITDMTSGIMSAITAILVAFAGISLVVTLVMIAIITYTSVLERTKEIGILRSLGARKKDITRVFDAETFIIGTLSSTLGIVIAFALTFPINILIKNLTDLSGVAVLNPLHAAGLFIIATLLIVLGGHIPARMASKKDAVEALRSE